ncbi:low molecular weight protein-tyrosine-phosphatase [Burkholderia ambifaria]|uniref:protein-tyrosine-phosphatase n=1 Tax=Burkholderia ambifaria MEX-5 TaxID=396597 RepID=B1SXA0_9BURK|nr:low molecular weight protein-tyrosine-phosphatase [Burkholderia ambifaria]EDT44007.1 protein tyrosine phosphatase [Burkholderia ambifaria MEX-5]
MIARILVVCEGNLCRSPLAQAMLTRALPGLAVASAGLSAIDGQPVDPVTDELSRARGIDLSSHCAARLDDHMCTSADLILAMEREQVRAIASVHPFTRGRVYRLAGTADIPDPYRRSLPRYEHAIALIERGVHDWVARVHQMNRRGGTPSAVR